MTRSSPGAGSPSRTTRSATAPTRSSATSSCTTPTRSAQRSRSDFGLSSRVTHVELDAGEHLDWFGLRTTLVLAETEALPLADRPCARRCTATSSRSPIREEALAPGRASRWPARASTCVARSRSLRMTLADGTPVALAVPATGSR